MNLYPYRNKNAEIRVNPFGNDIRFLSPFHPISLSSFPSFVQTKFYNEQRRENGWKEMFPQEIWNLHFKYWSGWNCFDWFYSSWNLVKFSSQHMNELNKPFQKKLYVWIEHVFLSKSKDNVSTSNGKHSAHLCKHFFHVFHYVLTCGWH